jgi:RNA polymerase sigma factor (sigma-70 family)
MQADTDDEDTLIEPQDFYLSENNTPEEAYTRKLFWQALEAGLALLPDKQRLVFEMHELQGMSFNDIAEVTGESVKTLLSRKHYAVKKLRKHLNDFYNENIQDK